MIDKMPFTKEEEEVMSILVSAHNKFMSLKRGHPSELNEWLISFHRLQDILGHRVLTRDYPNFFNDIKKQV